MNETEFAQKSIRGRCPRCKVVLTGSPGLRLDCPNCHAVVIVPAQVSPAQVATPQMDFSAPLAAPHNPALGIASCVMAGLLSWPLFWLAHIALDNETPAAGIAFALHSSLVLLTAGATLAAKTYLKPVQKSMIHALWVLIPTALLAASFGTQYNNVYVIIFTGIPLMVLTIPFFNHPQMFLVSAGVVLLTLSAIVTVVAHLGWKQRAPPRIWMSIVFGWGFAAGHAAASLLILITFPLQLETAESAYYSSPGPIAGLLVSLLIIGSLARCRLPF